MHTMHGNTAKHVIVPSELYNLCYTELYNLWLVYKDLNKHDILHLLGCFRKVCISITVLVV